ncbi:MAG: hypothetical protein MJ252_18655, partial [archaeon]|nr:hypothetical protein [archaeon]
GLGIGPNPQSPIPNPHTYLIIFNTNTIIQYSNNQSIFNIFLIKNHSIILIIYLLNLLKIILLNMKKDKSVHKDDFLFKTHMMLNKKLSGKYNSRDYQYIDITVNNLIFNERCRIVAMFKDFLIIDDNTEFLRRFYSSAESEPRLKRITMFYETYSKIFPNYMILEESVYLYKNIRKKQKMIDAVNQIKKEEDENRKRMGKNKKTLNKKNAVFTEKVQASINKCKPSFEEDEDEDNFNNEISISILNKKMMYKNDSFFMENDVSQSMISMLNAIDLSGNDNLFTNEKKQKAITTGQRTIESSAKNKRNTKKLGKPKNLFHTNTISNTTNSKETKDTFHRNQNKVISSQSGKPKKSYAASKPVFNTVKSMNIFHTKTNSIQDNKIHHKNNDIYHAHTNDINVNEENKEKKSQNKSGGQNIISSISQNIPQQMNSNQNKINQCLNQNNINSNTNINSIPSTNIISNTTPHSASPISPQNVDICNNYNNIIIPQPNTIININNNYYHSGGPTSSCELISNVNQANTFNGQIEQRDDNLLSSTNPVNTAGTFQTNNSIQPSQSNETPITSSELNKISNPIGSAKPAKSIKKINANVGHKKTVSQNLNNRMNAFSKTPRDGNKVITNKAASTIKKEHISTTPIYKTSNNKKDIFISNSNTLVPISAREKEYNSLAKSQTLKREAAKTSTGKPNLGLNIPSHLSTITHSRDFSERIKSSSNLKIPKKEENYIFSPKEITRTKTGKSKNFKGKKENKTGEEYSKNNRSENLGNEHNNNIKTNFTKNLRNQSNTTSTSNFKLSQKNNTLVAKIERKPSKIKNNYHHNLLSEKGNNNQGVYTINSSLISPRKYTNTPKIYPNKTRYNTNNGNNPPTITSTSANKQTVQGPSIANSSVKTKYKEFLQRLRIHSLTSRYSDDFFSTSRRGQSKDLDYSLKKKNQNQNLLTSSSQSKNPFSSSKVRENSNKEIKLVKREISANTKKIHGLSVNKNQTSGRLIITPSLTRESELNKAKNTEGDKNIQTNTIKVNRRKFYQNKKETTKNDSENNSNSQGKNIGPNYSTKLKTKEDKGFEKKHYSSKTGF